MISEGVIVKGEYSGSRKLRSAPHLRQMPALVPACISPKSQWWTQSEGGGFAGLGLHSRQMAASWRRALWRAPSGVIVSCQAISFHVRPAL